LLGRRQAVCPYLSAKVNPKDLTGCGKTLFLIRFWVAQRFIAAISALLSAPALAAEVQLQLAEVFFRSLLRASTFSHISALPLLIVLILCAVSVFGLLINYRYAQLALAAVTLIWITPLVLSKIPVFSIPLWAQNSFQSHASWPIANIGRPEKFFLLFASPLFLFLAVRYSDRFSRQSLCFFGACALFSTAVLLNPFLNFSLGPTNLPGRMSILSYVLASLLAPGLILGCRKHREAMDFGSGLCGSGVWFVLCAGRTAVRFGR
jgi:hypothetical protein